MSCQKDISIKINYFQDTIAVTKNMTYNFEEDDVELPTLEEFKTRLASQMLRSSFFQDEEKEIFDMTRLPNIIAPRLLKKQTNSDREKETLFNKKVSYGSETMVGLTKLIAKQKIDILQLDKMSGDTVKKTSKLLCIKNIPSKSNVRLLEEIKFVCKMYEVTPNNRMFC